MKTTIVSGYFNPVHAGHLDYLEAASKLGDRLVVIVNNDLQVELKGSVSFMPQDARLRIVSSLRVVDEAVMSIDDDLTVCKTLQKCFKDAQREPGYFAAVVFANGGDQTAETIPETGECERLGIEMVFGVGGEKVVSSSGLIEKAAG